MSKSDDLGMSQGITHIDCKAGQMSSKSNIDINAEVMKQSNLSYMYSNKVYSCSHCLMSICGENTYRKHVRSCSKYKCVNAIKLSSVSHHFKNTDKTVLQKISMQNL